MAATFLIGRLLFGGFFLISGLNHFLLFSMKVQFAAGKGVPFPEAGVALSGLLLIAGGVSILLGWRPDVGVAALVLFLVVVTPAMHDFWDETGIARTNDMTSFMKNVALCGGALMLVAVPRPWIYSVERSRTVRA